MAEDNKQAPQPQRLPNQPQAPQNQQQAEEANRKAAHDAQQKRRVAFEQEKKAVAERPQQTGDAGQKPTPTQAENDEIRAGIRHPDDKEDDGSGPDLRFVRRLESNDDDRRKYETR